MNADSLSLLINGAHQNTGNLGVSALGTSCVDWLRKTVPNAKCCLQNSTEPTVDVLLPEGKTTVSSISLHPSKSIRARFGTRHLSIANRIVGMTPAIIASPLLRNNETLNTLKSIDCVLDISAGDSFAEIYPKQQFMTQCEVKKFVQDLDIPLILMPQTIGPFKTDEGRALARRILDKCALIATRDAMGLSELEQLMGRSLDSRFVECPDMAFGLRPVPVDLAREPFVSESDHDSLIGLNVSALLFNKEDTFGLGGSNADLMHSVVHWAMTIPNAKLLLVPHVLSYVTPSGKFVPSDVEACRELLQHYSKIYPGRIGIVENRYGPAEIKYIIGKCGFFIGARMHACIAAISQGIPTATLAYSKKAAGVMGMAGVGESAIDLRGVPNESVLNSIKDLYGRKAEISTRALEEVSTVQSRISDFFAGPLQSIMARCRKR